MPPCITCLYRHSENQNISISLSLGWKQLCYIVLNFIQKPASEIYRWFCYNGHVGNMSFVLNISLIREQFLVLSIAELIWQSKVKYKFCPGLESTGFLCHQSWQNRDLVILVQYYYYLKYFVLDFGNLCSH